MGAARVGNESPAGAPKTARGARALPDADACRALLQAWREVRRIAEPLAAAALAGAAGKETNKEIKAQRQRADEAWRRAAAEADQDFDSEQAIQGIHAELREPNAAAAALAGRSEGNFANLLE